MLDLAPPSSRPGAAADAAVDAHAFRGATPRAALDAVRRALGGDAILLSTREVRSARGPMEIEILARAPGARPALHAPTPAAAHSSEPRGIFNDAGPLAPPSGAACAPEAVVARLVDAGVAEVIARRLVERAARLPRRRALADGVGATLDEVLCAGDAPWTAPPAPRRRVVALVGPTGVGKTTTIAKMAARALLDTKLSVALVTIDTWRIGAVDQLRRYGEIMNLATYVARDAKALAEVLARTARADLVLIDTAGRSPLETETFAQQLTVLKSAPDVEIHLAAAAGSSVKQLRALRERYAALATSGIVVTKLDEADGRGGLVNVAAVLARAVTCFTDGQRVPEDLHAFDVRAFTEELL